MTAWANFTVSGNGCTCCNVAPPACFLSLPPPIGDGGYADFATANGVINNQTDNCLAFANMDAGAGGFITSLVATQPAGNTAFINYVGLDFSALPDVGRLWLGCTAAANTYINVAFETLADTYAGDFYYSNGASAGSITGATNSALISTADNIAIRLVSSRVFGSGSIGINVNVFSPNAVSFCSIRANYASGGGYAWLNC